MNDEPRIPEGLKARLVVGARVRVRLTGECLFDLIKHGDSTRGSELVGTIERISEDREAHHYGVRLDPPHQRFVPSYAAAELEPLDDDWHVYTIGYDRGESGGDKTVIYKDGVRQ